jgi:hypothetical protein
MSWIIHCTWYINISFHIHDHKEKLRFLPFTFTRMRCASIPKLAHGLCWYPELEFFDPLESIRGLHKNLQIRALARML